MSAARQLVPLPLFGRFAVDTDRDAVWIITDDLDDPDTATTILWPCDH